MIESILLFSGIDDLVREDIHHVDLMKYQLDEQNAIRIYYQTNTKYKRIVDVICHLMRDNRIPEKETTIPFKERLYLTELLIYEFKELCKALNINTTHLEAFYIDEDGADKKGDIQKIKAAGAKLILHTLAVFSLHGIDDREILNNVSEGLLSLAR